MAVNADFIDIITSKPLTGYNPAGNDGNSSRYALSRIAYSAGTMLRASDSSIGRIAMVPLSVPVVWSGYWALMGFGCDCVRFLQPIAAWA